ncbi:uncharacterized protein LOC110245732 isoform X2 [Exaiptasia diaphana]|uniref:Uncharacterized protein n=1 Tax=Exaiptasia diaphana TaxID=2652724 RepID=A0A913YN00_EXADI|nr:uncharacterized protein LOC110245732 isoform X2 [Exaiptasia diaphana]
MKSDHVQMEIVAQRKWPDRWGFFAETYDQLEQSLEEIGDEIPPNAKVKNTTADLATRAFEIYDFKPEKSGKNPNEKFPETDSKHIGWRLNFKAPISQYIIKSTGKKDILRQLEWPAESL